MNHNQEPERIRDAARRLDEAIERKDIEEAVSRFSDGCEIELLGRILKGREGARKWLKWLFSTLDEISFEPVTIMVDGNTFFEEFILKARLKNGLVVRSKQSEVLDYENYEVNSLRIYFDRLDFAESIGNGPVKKVLIDMIRKASLKGLI
jgi:hypothetical protein